jgi:hypothetical protein
MQTNILLRSVSKLNKTEISLSFLIICVVIAIPMIKLKIALNKKLCYALRKTDFFVGIIATEPQVLRFKIE